MADNFPFQPIEPFAEGMLQVDDIHSLYWEVSGSQSGVPLVILHGGPGGPGGPNVRRCFDPEFYKIVYFHQRGSGRSTPLGELRNNTTQLLVSDIERLRKHLGIDRWAVAGGSWGSALALVYGQAHPEVCRGFLLNGIFLARRSDVQWFLTTARDFYPDAWRALVEFLPEHERSEILSAYYRRITDPDPAVNEPAVRAWAAYEATIAALVPNDELKSMVQEPDFALAYSRMNVHYFTNGCFLDNAPILAGMGRLAALNAILVHGRYDLSAAYRNAVELVEHWPRAELITVPIGGHTRLEQGVGDALAAAAEAFKERLS